MPSALAGPFGGWGVLLLGAAHGLLIVAAGFHFGLTARGLVALPTIMVLALAALLDLQHKTIPDWLTLPGLVWVLAANLSFLGPRHAGEALLGALACGSAMFLLAVVSRGAIGGGDVKLMAVVGAALGWRWGFVALLLAQLAAALPALVLLATGRRGRKSALPFGPFLSPSAILMMIAKSL